MKAPPPNTNWVQATPYCALLFIVAQRSGAPDPARSAHHMSLSNCPPAGSGGMNSYAP